MMHIEHACQTIAFYDGYRDAFNPCGGNFKNQPELTRYLKFENLVPIWEKIGFIGFNLRFDKGEDSIDHSYYLIDRVGDEYGRKMPNNTENLLERIIIATALAINELEKE